MKRILKIVGLIVLLIVIGVGALIAVTFVGRKAIMDGQEINGIRIVADGITSFAVVPIDSRQVVLIDAGNDQTGKAALRRADAPPGSGPEAVSTIFLTHGHPDHTGAVHLFPNAQVMALEPDVALVEGRAGSKGPVTRLFPVSPTGITVNRVLHGGDVVTIGSTPIRRVHGARSYGGKRGVPGEWGAADWGCRRRQERRLTPGGAVDLYRQPAGRSGVACAARAATGGGWRGREGYRAGAFRAPWKASGR